MTSTAALIFLIFHIFADDTNLLCKHKNPLLRKVNINNELTNVNLGLVLSSCLSI